MRERRPGRLARLLGWAIFLAALGASPALLAADPAAEPADAEFRIRSISPRQFVKGILLLELEIRGPEAAGEFQILRDGIPVGAAASSPDQLEWDTRSETDGPHRLQVRLLGSTGQERLSPPLTVLVDNAPPQCHLLEPQRQATVVGPVELKAEASDLFEVREVRFLVDGIPIGSVSAPPYQMTWDSSRFSNGSRMLEAKALDGAGNMATSPGVEIRIANKNYPPIFTPIEPMKVEEGKRLAFQVKAADPDGPRDSVTYRLLDVPGWARFDPKTGEFQGTPDAAQASLTEPEKTLTLKFQACDPEPLCTSLEVPVTIVNVNAPPTLPAIPDVALREGQPLSIALSAAQDPDQDPLTYTARGLPAWLSFDPSTRIISGTPPPDVAGLSEEKVLYEVTVKACDGGGLCDEKSFRVTLENKNSPPVIKSIPQIRAQEGQTIAFRVQATDSDGDPIAFGVSALPEGMAFQDGKKGTAAFAWATRLDQAGRYQITLAASDGNLKDTETIVIDLEEKSLSLSGVILDRTEEPFPNAVVQLTSAGQSRKYALTDAKGFYIISGLEPRTYTVKADFAPSEEFSTEARSSISYHFIPLSRRVTIEREDQTEVNFMAQPQ